jgi:hypothetical protein
MDTNGLAPWTVSSFTDLPEPWPCATIGTKTTCLKHYWTSSIHSGKSTTPTHSTTIPSAWPSYWRAYWRNRHRHPMPFRTLDQRPATAAGGERGEVFLPWLWREGARLLLGLSSLLRVLREQRLPLHPRRLVLPVPARVLRDRPADPGADPAQARRSRQAERFHGQILWLIRSGGADRSPRRDQRRGRYTTRYTRAIPTHNSRPVAHIAQATARNRRSRHHQARVFIPLQRRQKRAIRRSGMSATPIRATVTFTSSTRPRSTFARAPRCRPCAACPSPSPGSRRSQARDGSASSAFPAASKQRHSRRPM